MPLMFDFWELIIFQSSTYFGNPMQPHLILHYNSPMREEHFYPWLQLFSETIDELYEGDNSEFAKSSAQTIAATIQAKIYSSTFG